MKKMYPLKSQTRKILVMMMALIIGHISVSNAQTVSTFENLTLAADSYWNGISANSGFSDGEAYFYNDYHYDPSYSYNSGFAYSNQADVVTSGPANQFSAYTGEGYNGSDNYVIGNYDAYSGGNLGIKLTGVAVGKSVNGFFVTNTTYAALSMRDGDLYAKKFGGGTGDDADWFKLTITGYLGGVASASAVDFYLADFRFSDNSQDYILDTWKWVDLNSLGNVDSLAFSLSSSDDQPYGMNTPAYFAIDNFNDPLYAPAAGIAGTTAIYKDSSAFVAWATACTVDRGPWDISVVTSPDASFGDNTLAIGPATGSVVSLGDGGSAILTFANPIANSAGPDFAVFENGFAGTGGLAFLELAFVEVSSDGINFFRFPSASLTDETIQINNANYLNAKKINNLAGKYVGAYGTPFDLEELKNEIGLDVNNITHVRIIDVVGSINPIYATYDSYGNKINDPWPTAFASGGFDLDAVGVIHVASVTGIATASVDNRIEVYPNPLQQDQDIILNVNIPVSNEMKVQIFNYSGQLIKENSINGQYTKVSTEGMDKGMYVLKMIDKATIITKKIIVN